MNLIYYAIIAVVVIGLLVGAIAIVFKKDTGGKKDGQKKKKVTAKDRNTILKETNRRLSQNPKDHRALNDLADLYFQEQDYEKAHKFYTRLLSLCASVPELNEFEINLRYGQTALKLKKMDEAYKSFMIARTQDENNFEVNYNLGYLEYIRKNYQKAALYLNRARSVNTDHVDTNRYLGHSLCRIKKFKEAVAFLRKTLELEPEDKNSLFALAQVYSELGQNEYAQKIFSHLRTDPVFGANAALYSGTIHLKTKQYQKAILDFEIGLRHENIPKPVTLELKYRLASVFLKQNEIGNAIKQWEEILKIQPEYKDVKAQIDKYREISTNRSLQVFLMASTSEYVALCRKIAAGYFNRASVKLIDINLKNEYVDILADINTRQWEDMVLFRFIRSSGVVGELMLRELYSRIKDVKAGRGICITSGSYSDTAESFVEARLIDLKGKDDLLKLFQKLRLNT